MLTALLWASAAHAATPCVEPPADAGFPPVTLQQVAQGLREPVHIAVAPDGSGRLYVVEQAGVVRIVEHGQVRAEPFLDIRSQVESGGEKGLLSIAFHPRYRDNGLFFLDYTASDAAGLLKEELDADGGSGFSFGDLLADRAGVTFASRATRDEASARALQDRLAAGFRVADYFPPADDLPEGIPDEELQSRYGGVGGPGYLALIEEMERRLVACPGYR